mmetsp:Transcript_14277/g.30486  ORF Transcript_14277/g.30486 Transcript_14277/m.30486 type:complete len:423 (+) Transcript_14277:240-1508(+)|eukprot:CAMPEP_0196131532 /NCGR_PEP_ID=MMETSP0910-20130528/1503_1 /TAXON_ID=49265 /ORGANISM="Thalassiosira rotula, Strain GSO102" /LENGTH=422 /DNA_ID=CAMNT_0041391009 /DNA_START=116 /DNA_END=1384 /DNA_ORIENTATION=-
MSTFKAATKGNIARGVGRMADLVFTKGNGSYVQTSCGKELLDFTTGIGVVNTGHSHPRVVAAAKEQVEKIVHSQVNIGYHDKMLELTEMLLPNLPRGLDTIYYGTTGAEAVENAVKMARAMTGKHAVVVFRGGYHGRTFGTMAMTTSSRIYRQKFGPLIPGIHVTPFPYEYHGITTDMAMEELEQLFKDTLHEDDVAAFLVEPVLGEGGYVPAPPDFLRKVREFANSKRALMICDEVQTGFGRTGSLFACDSDYYGDDVAPDILTMAKGIASGFPLSGVATYREIANQCDPGMLGGTYAGNALSCAAAIATQKVIQEENLVENSVKMGERLRDNLRSIQQSEVSKGLIGDVRGLGLMTGVEFIKEAEAGIKAKLSQACVEENLLLLGCSTYEVVRFVPPLNISEEDIDIGCEKFENALKSVL